MIEKVAATKQIEQTSGKRRLPVENFYDAIKQIRAGSSLDEPALYRVVLIAKNRVGA